MTYIKRHIPPRYRKPRARKRHIRRVFLLFIAIFSLGAIISEIGLSSVSQQLTEQAGRRYLLSCIHEAMNQELKEREDSFVDVSKGEDGKALWVSANTGELNALKNGLQARLEKLLNGKAKVGLPIGSLTEVAIFNGRGFQVPIKLQFEGAADISFHTEFVSAGINQSCHRITMTIMVRAYSQSRRFEALVETETTTVLAETVVVGDVPSTGLYLGN